jgi:uncharacterized RDD family membrane protein YckC
MKCPKCGYLGFDSSDRCKNCGYDFSLMPAGSAPGQIGGPLLREPGLARGSRYRRSDDAGRDGGVDRPLAGHAEGTPIDLPLFGDAGIPGALPPPRPPLQVRRATPAPGRLRARSETPLSEALKLDLEAGPAPSTPTPAPVAAAVTADEHESSRAASSVAAPAGRRVAAALIDVALAAAIDAGMLYFTLRLCDLTSNDVHALPLVPLVAFFFVLNGGYVILLTGTLGQTLGKMAAGIEVVSDRRGGMDIGRATLRTLAATLSIALAGGGWLAGLVGERRALHDRLTGTRVIQISAS